MVGFLSLLLWSCSFLGLGESTDPGTAQVAPEAERQSTAKKGGIVGKPYVLNQKIEQGHEYESGLTFLGWSADDRYYAFELDRPSMGGADCDFGRIELEIVDASTDKWAKNARLVVENKDQMNCTYGDAAAIRRAFDAAKLSKLRKYDIDIGHLLQPLKLEGNGPEYNFPLLNGETATVFFATDTTSEMYDKLGYKLAWRAPFKRTMERGKKRDCMSGYKLNSIFRSPGGTHAAFVVEKFMCAYEGEERGFMTNGSPINKTGESGSIHTRCHLHSMSLWRRPPVGSA